MFLCYRFEMRPFPTFLYAMVRLKKGIAVSSCYVVYQGHNGMCGGAMPSKSTMYTHPFFGSQMHPSFSSSSPRIFSILHIRRETTTFLLLWRLHSHNILVLCHISAGNTKKRPCWAAGQREQFAWHAASCYVLQKLSWLRWFRIGQINIQFHFFVYANHPKWRP